VLAAETPLQLSCVGTRQPRLMFNETQAGDLGVSYLFSSKQIRDNQRPFYVLEGVENGFVMLKTRAFSKKAGYDGHELRLKVVV